MSDTDPDFVPVRLVCSGCKQEHTIALPADNVLRNELAKLACPSCKILGVLGLVRKRKKGLT